MRFTWHGGRNDKAIFPRNQIALALLLAIAAALGLSLVQPRRAEAAPAPANGRILFIRDGDVWFRDSKGGEEKLPSGDGKINSAASEAWAVSSPDGSKIAFASDRATPDSSTDYEVYVIDADGATNLDRLTDNSATNPNDAMDSAPTWSPSSDELAFTSNIDGDFDIYKIAVTGAALEQLTTNPARDFGPAWAPTGTRIAFTSDRATDTPVDPSTQIYIMDLSLPKVGDEYQAPFRTNDNGTNRAPDWSPDGTTIVYMNTPVNDPNQNGEEYDIFTVPVAGGAGLPLVTNPGFDGFPVFSATGNQIVFVSKRSDGSDTDSDLYSIAFPAVGLPGSEVRLTDNALEDTSPAWESLLGCDVVFDGSNNNAVWQQAANWDTNVVPTSAQHVCLPDMANMTSVSFQGGTVDVASIKGTEVLSIDSGQLDVTETSTLGSGVIMNGGAFGGAGDILLHSTSRWPGATGFNGAGKTVVSDGAVLRLTSRDCCSRDHYLSRTIENHGTLDLSDSNNLFQGTNGKLVNAAGGLIVKTAGGSVDIGVPVENAGEIRSESQRLNLKGGGTGSGRFVATPTGELSFTTGTFELTDTAVLEGNGVMINGATLTAAPGGSKKIQIDNGTTVVFYAGTLGSEMTLAPKSSNPELPDAQFHWWQATGMPNQGTITVAPKMTLKVVSRDCCSRDHHLGRLVENHGTIVLDQNNSIYQTGGAGAINNHTDGVITKTNSGSPSDIDVPVNNQGLVTSDIGTLALMEGGTSSGTFRARGDAVPAVEAEPGLPAAHIRFGAADFNLDDAALIDGGASGHGVYMDGGTLFATGPTNTINFANGGKFYLYGGTLVGKPGLGADKGDIRVNAKTGTAKILWHGARGLGDAGKFIVDDSMTLAVVSRDCCSRDHYLQGTRTIQNEGNLVLDDNNGLYKDTGATLVAVDNLGTLVKTNGGGGTSPVNMPLHNKGVVSSLSGRLQLNAGGINTGKFEARGTAQAATDTEPAIPAAHIIFQGGDFTLSDTALLDGGVTGKGISIEGGTYYTNGPTNTIRLSQNIELPLWAGTLVGHPDTGDLQLAPAAGTAKVLWYQPEGFGTKGTVNIHHDLTLQLSSRDCCSRDHYLQGSRVIENHGTLLFVESNSLLLPGGATSKVVNAADGLIDKPNGGHSTIGPRLENAGTIRSLSSRFNLSGGGRSTGTFVGEAGEIAFTGGIHTLTDSALLKGSGLMMNGGDVAADQDGSKVIHIENGTTVVMYAGALVGEVTLAPRSSDPELPEAAFHWWQSVGMSDPGTLTIAPRMKFQLVSRDCCSRDHYLGRSIENHGTIVMDDNNSFYALNPTGAIHNNAGAVLVKRNGGDGTAVIDVPLHNDGQVTSEIGFLSLNEGGTASGTFSARGIHTPATESAAAIPRAHIRLGAGDFLLSDAALLDGGETGFGIYLEGATLKTSGATNTIHLSNGSIFDMHSGTVLGNTDEDDTLGDVRLAAKTGTAKARWFQSHGLGSAGKLTIMPNFTLELASRDCCSRDHYLAGSRSIVNKGTFRMEDNNSLHAQGSGTFTNEAGALVVKTNGGQGRSEIDPPLHNAGTVRSESGYLTVDGGGNGTGLYQARGDGVAGTEEVPAIQAAYIAFRGGPHTLSDTALLDGGVSGNGVYLEGGTFEAVGPNKLIRLSDGSTLIFYGGTINGDAKVVPGSGTATFRWFQPHGLGDAGTFTVGQGATMTLVARNCCERDHYLAGTRILRNEGTIKFLDNSDIDVSSGTPKLINAAPGMLTTDFGGNPCCSDIKVPIENAGLVKPVLGHFRFYGGGSSQGGTWEAPGGDGSVIEFTQGTYALDGSTVKGNGVYTLNGTLDLDDGVDLATKPEGGKVTIAEGSSLGIDNAGTLAGTGVIDGQGTLRWVRQDGLGDSGILTVAENATLRVDGNYVHRLMGSRKIANKGKFVVQHHTQDLHFATNGDTAEFRNLGAGQFVADPTGGTLEISAPFENKGLIDLKGGTMHLLPTGGLTSFDAATGSLTEGTYKLAGTLKSNNLAITKTAGKLVYQDTTGSLLDHLLGADAVEEKLAQILPGGGLTIKSGKDFTKTGTFTNAGDVVIDGIEADNSVMTVGTFVQSGGSLTLVDEYSKLVTDNVALEDGLLGGSGDFDSNISNTGGTVSPGNSPGQINIDGNYSQGAEGSFEVEVGGSSGGTEFDQVHATGTGTLDGTLDLSVINGFAPQVDQTFDVLIADGGLSGQFSKVEGFDIGNGMYFDVNYLTDRVQLKVKGRAVTIAPTTAVTEGNEGTKTVDVAVTISKASTSPVTVQFTTSNGTATAGSDYVSKDETITWTPGDPLTKNVAVTINGDAKDENDETFTATLSSPGNSGLKSGETAGTVTIEDDDSTPSVSVSSPAATPEGAAGVNTPLVFTATRTAGDTDLGTMEVDYTVTGLTATAATDFTADAMTGTLLFTAEELSKDITINIVGDGVVEADETVQVVLSNAKRMALGVSTAVSTITNDDPKVASKTTLVLSKVKGGVKAAGAVSPSHTGKVSVQLKVKKGAKWVAVGKARSISLVASKYTTTFKLKKLAKSYQVTAKFAGDIDHNASQAIKTIKY